MLQLAVRIRTNTGLWRVASVVADRGAEAGWRGDTDLFRRRGPVECAMTHSLNYATNVARLRIPRACLGALRWVQATVVSSWIPGGRASAFFYDNAHDEGFRFNVWTRRLRRG